jgi:hypothetical protein
MGLFDWLNTKGSRDAEHRTRIAIDPQQVTIAGKSPVKAAAEAYYIRLWINEMFLRKDREWFTTRYPLAYSLISLKFGDRMVDFANVSGKNKLEINQPDLGRSILTNFPLTPLLPFRGGTAEIDCGLVSMQAADILKSFAGVVSSFAAKVNVPQVSAVVDIAASVADGLQALLGAGEAITKLHVHETFTAGSAGASLQSGFIFLSEKPDGVIDAKQLWITPEGIRYGASARSADPLDPQDYLLLEIEVAETRDDWESISYLSKPFLAALDARDEGNEDKANLLLAQAIRAARHSVDLTQNDRKRVAEALRRGLVSGTALPQTTAGLETAVNPLSALERALSMVSVTEARTLPDSTLDDTLLEPITK